MSSTDGVAAGTDAFALHAVHNSKGLKGGLHGGW